jgi:hypothetical protein
MQATDGDRPSAPHRPTNPADGPGKTAYPPLPPHVMERLAGYVGPGLRKRMSILREAQAAEAKAHAPTA